MQASSSVGKHKSFKYYQAALANFTAEVTVLEVLKQQECLSIILV